MDNTSQQKVIAQGFTILRKMDDKRKITIEKKDSAQDAWSTYAIFETTESRNEAFNRFMELSFVINDK